MELIMRKRLKLNLAQLLLLRTFTHGLPLFTRVKFTCVRTEKLRDSGNQMNIPRLEPSFYGQYDK